jgi:hypothetical protein
MRLVTVNVIVSLTGCAFGVGCGGRAPAATSATAEPEAEDAAPPLDRQQLESIALGLHLTLAQMAEITENAVDCPTMATRLGELFDKRTPLFELARTKGADPEAGPVLSAMVDARATEVKPLVDRISAGLARCQLDPAVAAAMERMPTL